MSITEYVVFMDVTLQHAYLKDSTGKIIKALLDGNVPRKVGTIMTATLVTIGEKEHHVNVYEYREPKERLLAIGKNFFRTLKV